jgi:APA family basic amino acid/polyamine antiporter
MATALVVGNMIGSGVFLLPRTLAKYGPTSIAGWGFTAAGAVLLAPVFARLGRTYPRTGGPYAYARRHGDRGPPSRPSPYGRVGGLR